MGNENQPRGPHSPIVDAVHADPVVQAVLESASAPDRRAPSTVTTQAGNVVASPTSTEEDERVSLGQRTVNLIWENTQANLATKIIYAVLIVAAIVVIIGMLPGATEAQIALAISAFLLLSNLSTLVLGFYYGRTNHQKVGGVIQGR